MVHSNIEYARFADTDAGGVLYYGSFASYFEESILSLLRNSKIGWEEHKKHNFLIPVIKYNVRYHYPVKWGEKLVVYCGIAHFGKTSFTTFQVMKSFTTGKINAGSTITRVTVDFKTFEPVILPDILKNITSEHYEKFNSLELSDLEKKIEIWSKQ